MVCYYSVVFAGQLDLFLQGQEKAILDDTDLSEDHDPNAVICG